MRRATLLAIVLVGCPSPAPVPPAPDADSGQPLADAAPIGDACAAGEENLVKLACADSRGQKLAGPNFHGVMWGETCRYNAMHGVPMAQNCVARAKTCAEVMSCR